MCQRDSWRGEKNIWYFVKTETKITEQVEQRKGGIKTRNKLKGGEISKSIHRLQIEIFSFILCYKTLSVWHLKRKEWGSPFQVSCSMFLQEFLKTLAEIFDKAKIELNYLIRRVEHFFCYKWRVQIIFLSTLSKAHFSVEQCWKHRSGLLQQAYYLTKKLTMWCVVRRQDASS